CVLLEDCSNAKFCIGCCEVDADTKKDNPAVSDEAARISVEEIQHRQKPDKGESPMSRPNIKPEVSQKPKVVKETPNSTAFLSVVTSTTEARPSAECRITD
ncbi:hypothetical protein SK128_000251, partial [Halocaridina rubra]